MNSKTKNKKKNKKYKTKQNQNEKNNKLVTITLLLPKNLRCVCIKWIAFRIGNQDDFFFMKTTLF